MSWRSRGRLRRKRWQHQRRRALDRDGWRCRACGKAGRLEVDHVTPLDRGGEPYDLANLQTLCRACHFAKTGKENRQRDKTPPERSWNQAVTELLP